MRFDINKFKGKYAMNCKTFEEAQEFCELLNSLGRRWRCGQRYEDSYEWHAYEEETCYDFNNGFYCEKKYWEKRGHTILEWSDFSNKKEVELV